MKCAQNLRFLVDQKPSSLKLLGAAPPMQTPCFRDPLSIKPFSYMHVSIPKSYVLKRQLAILTSL